MIKKIRFHEIKDHCINFLDKGGILHVTEFPGAEKFLNAFQSQSYLSGHVPTEDWEKIFLDREVRNLKILAATTRILKQLVYNHAYAMAILPLIQRIGCSIETTHIDCGVIRYQLLNDLRRQAEASGYFENEDFVRPSPLGIAEIFGYSKLPPHRDIRWPHIRLLGGWMPLTDLKDSESLTLFPDVFSQSKALIDPAITPFPAVDNASELSLGQPFSPAMRAGEFLLFHSVNVHSSPVRQLAEFRGSIDFRVAYPCIDDFAHYKWTFIQARNLIHLGNHIGPINMGHQNTAFDSLVGELFDNRGSKRSIHEIYLSYEKSGKQLSSRKALHLVLNHFCPDTYMKFFTRTKRTGQFILLTAICFRSNSYFWLYQANLRAKESGFLRLAGLLEHRVRKACVNTKLAIVNIPLKWPGHARELMPEEVLQRLDNSVRNLEK